MHASTKLKMTVENPVKGLNRSDIADDDWLELDDAGAEVWGLSAPSDAPKSPPPVLPVVPVGGTERTVPLGGLEPVASWFRVEPTELALGGGRVVVVGEAVEGNICEPPEKKTVVPNVGDVPPIVTVAVVTLEIEGKSVPAKGGRLAPVGATAVDVV